jgi:hypothetical protein
MWCKTRPTNTLLGRLPLRDARHERHGQHSRRKVRGRRAARRWRRRPGRHVPWRRRRVPLPMLWL